MLNTPPPPAQKKDVPLDVNIPVLTDVLPSSDIRSFSEIAWNELEKRLSERILEQTVKRLNIILDESIPKRISAVLEQTATMISEEIKRDLQNTIEVIVTHAIFSELQRLKKQDTIPVESRQKIQKAG